MKFNNNKTNIPLKIGQKPNRHFTKEDILIMNKYMKRCSTSYVIKEIQIKTVITYYYTPIRMVKIKNIGSTKCWWGCGAIGNLIHCWWEWIIMQIFWKTVWWFLIKLNIFLSYDSAINLLSIHPTVLKTYVCKHLHMDVYRRKWKREIEVAQLCPTLCNTMDCSLPDSSIHGIFQSRILKWVVISFSRGCSRPRYEPRSPTLQVDFLPSEPPGKIL